MIFFFTKKKLTGNKAYNLIKMTIEGFPVPPGFSLYENEVLSDVQLYNLYYKCIKHGNVSVRSSSNHEDNKRKSGAGFYKTIINLNYEEIPQAIHSIRGDGSKKRLMPIIIQKYIIAKISGVAFSINPINGLNDIYIEYHTGECEKVVSGRIIPEVTIFKKNDIHNDKVIPKKLVQYIIHLEIFFGLPVDVEWCIDKDGKIWILQCRPVTIINQNGYQYAWSTREPLWAMDLAFKTRCATIGNKKDNRYFHKDIIYSRNEKGLFDCYIGLIDHISVLKYVKKQLRKKYITPIEIKKIPISPCF